MGDQEDVMKYVLSLIVSLAFAPSALAEEPALTDGELHVTLSNAEYVKVQLNGEDWDNIEFERNGKVVVIKGIQTTLDRNAVTLIPQAETGLAPLDVDVFAKEFKKKRVGRVLYLVATKTVTFTKAPAEPDPGKAPPPPKEPDVAPPPPEKDDL
jgi:hypothetical protein